MRRSIPLLVVILVVQLGLAALLAARRNPLAAATPQTALITTSLDHVDHITIEGQPAAGASASSARVELVKQADHWVLPDYFNAPVDKFRLASVLSELGSLKRGLPIATSSTALERFKLMDDNFERRVTLRQGDKPLSTVYFGSSAGVRKTDARTARDHAVYNVDLATYELPTSSSDWLDADILQRDPTSLSEVDIDSPGAHAPLKLLHEAPKPVTATTARATSGAAVPKVWVDPSVPAGRQLDAGRADNLAREISELHVEGILGVSPEPQWQPDHPALTLHIGDDKHLGQLQTWMLYAPPSAQPAGARPTGAKGTAAQSPARPLETYYVLKDSAQPWYFKISSVAGKQLLDDSSPEQLLIAATPPGKGAHESPEVSAAHTHPPNHPRRAAGANKPTGA